MDYRLEKKLLTIAWFLEYVDLTGVEVVEAAVPDTRKNAEINNVKNVEFLTGEAKRVVSVIIFLLKSS